MKLCNSWIPWAKKKIDAMFQKIDENQTNEFPRLASTKSSLRTGGSNLQISTTSIAWPASEGNLLQESSLNFRVPLANTHATCIHYPEISFRELSAFSWRSLIEIPRPQMVKMFWSQNGTATICCNFGMKSRLSQFEGTRVYISRNRHATKIELEQQFWQGGEKVPVLDP